jgi:hypothetical protein
MKLRDLLVLAAAGGLGYYLWRRYHDAPVVGSVTIASVECAGGACVDAAPASQSWLSSKAPDHFLNIPTPWAPQ